MKTDYQFDNNLLDAIEAMGAAKRARQSAEERADDLGEKNLEQYDACNKTRRARSEAGKFLEQKLQDFLEGVFVPKADMEAAIARINTAVGAKELAEKIKTGIAQKYDAACEERRQAQIKYIEAHKKVFDIILGRDSDE